MLEDEFGDIILKARAGLGLSVDFISKKMELTKTEVTQIEAYAKKPTQRQIELFATLLHLDPSRLREISSQMYSPKPAPSLLENRVHTVKGYIGTYEVKGYLVVDPVSGEAAMVDTANNPDGMIEVIDRNAWNLRYILLTHTHQDHIGGLDQILKQINVPVFVSEQEAVQLGNSWNSKKDRLVTEGDQFHFANILFEVLNVPGHTTGGRGYLFSRSDPPFGFFGDTIFAGSLGRAYSTISYPELLNSVREKVLSLPGETVLYPGHGPATTVEEEKEHNPFFNL
ncbi:MAG: MBL fold metallo-hydrolase [Nitrospiria bacterium]